METSVNLSNSVSKVLQRQNFVVRFPEVNKAYLSVTTVIFVVTQVQKLCFVILSPESHFRTET